MSLESLVAGGGSAVILVGLLGIGRLILGWIRERRQGVVTQAEVRSTAVEDRATENTILLGTMEALHKENERLQSRIEKQEEIIEELHREVAELREQLFTMQRQIAGYPVSSNES